jgi:hypothetical protein
MREKQVNTIVLNPPRLTFRAEFPAGLNRHEISVAVWFIRYRSDIGWRGFRVKAVKRWRKPAEFKLSEREIAILQNWRQRTVCP